MIIIDANQTNVNKNVKKSCPVVRSGKECIDIEDIAIISDSLCIGCGICVDVCPFNAIKIVNLPVRLINDLIYSYGINKFQLYKLPIPTAGKIYGILGRNGIGKSTLVNILDGSIKPNYGKYDDTNIHNILSKQRGTVLYKYLVQLYDNKFKIKKKPQNVGNVKTTLSKKYVTVKKFIKQ